MWMQFFKICLSFDAPCQQTHLLGDSWTAGAAKHQNKVLGALGWLSQASRHACAHPASASRSDTELTLGGGWAAGVQGCWWSCSWPRKASRKSGLRSQTTSLRKWASMLPDCLCFLLFSQGDMARLRKGKTRTTVTGSSGSCPGVPRARWGGEPPGSHPAGLQWPTLQDHSDWGGQETWATATDSAQLTTLRWEKAH